MRPNHRADSSISPMRPPCYPFLKEIDIVGIMHGSVGSDQRNAAKDHECLPMRPNHTADSSISPMRSPCYPFLKEIDIVGVIYGSVGSDQRIVDLCLPNNVSNISISLNSI